MNGHAVLFECVRRFIITLRCNKGSRGQSTFGFADDTEIDLGIQFINSFPCLSVRLDPFSSLLLEMFDFEFMRSRLRFRRSTKSG
ncbi:MAG TPA: hypothetical protein VI282_05090, partial [Verrucomicrobiae bacterium]